MHANICTHVRNRMRTASTVDGMRDNIASHVRIAFISYIHDRRLCAHASAKSDFPSRSRLFSGASIRTCFRCRPEWFMNQPFWTGVRRDFAKTCVCGSWMKPRKPRPESKRAVSCIQYDWWFASEAYDSAIIGVSRKKRNHCPQ